MEQSASAAEQQSPPTTQRPLLQQLGDGEKHWAWKMGIRITQAVLCLVGIGCLAWIVAVSFGPYRYSNLYLGYFDYFSVPFALSVLCLSFIWCAVCVLVPLLRHTHRPVHPGTAVAFDLILWLALIVTGLFTIATIYNTYYFGRGGYLEDYDYSSEYDGHYKLLANGTWVYKITYTGSPVYHFNRTTDNYTYSSPPVSSVHRVCTEFASCAAQDAAVNKLWQQRNARFGTEIFAAIAQWVGVAIHFALFVWACVDVHRRNSGVKQREMQDVADRLIRDMQARGMITVNDPLLAGRMAEEREVHEVRGAAGPGSEEREVDEVPAVGVAGPSTGHAPGVSG